MLRNPNEAHCRVPGLHNGAARGHTHCPSHRDAQSGPSAAASPTAGPNALKTGQHAYPSSSLLQLPKGQPSNSQEA